MKQNNGSWKTELRFIIVMFLVMVLCAICVFFASKVLEFIASYLGGYSPFRGFLYPLGG